MSPEIARSRAIAAAAKRQAIIDFLIDNPHSSAKSIYDSLAFDEAIKTTRAFLGVMVKDKEITCHGASYTAAVKKTRPAEIIPLEPTYVGPQYVDGRLKNTKQNRPAVKNPDAPRCVAGSFRQSHFLENTL